MTRFKLWRLSHSVALFFFAAIALMWYVQSVHYQSDPRQLPDRAAVEAYVADWDQISEAKGEPVVYVPTGIFLQSMEFTDANSVHVSAYLWQRYPNGISSEISRGFVMPEATSSRVTEAYRRTSEDGMKVIGWYFESVLRQNFDYHDYPLDHKTVWIRIWHADFDRNVVLVPDLSSYESTRPEDTFGIDEHIVLPDWSIRESFFELRPSQYDTNFGITNYIGQKNFPELYFNVVVKRQIIDALLIDVIPIATTNIILFSILMLTGVKHQSSTLFNFRAINVYTIIPLTTFTLVLLGVKLRDTLHYPAIVYAESFHLLTYLAILGVIANTYFFARTAESKEIGFFNWEDNLVPKLLFWPLFSGLGALVTFAWLFTG